MAGDKKKLVLVYPPYCPATSPPLGVCWLKGFLERSLPEWSVKVLDLNLAWHQELFAIMQQRPCLNGPAFPEGLLGDIALLRAAETFRGEHGDEFYNCPDRYTKYADLWIRFVPSELTNDRLLEQAYRGSVPMPAPIEARAEQVLQEQPTMVGLSVTYAQQIWFTLCLAKAMKRRSSVPIVAGGTFFNCDAETAWAAQFPEVDYVVSGEGERALAELLTTGEPQRVPGLSYRQEGRVVRNPPVFEENLDLLGEPDFSDLDLRAYYCPRPVLPVLTSRGCYWRRCAFCVHYKSAGQTYRRRSVAAVVDELRRHVEHGVQHFALADEMIAPAYFSELAEAIIAAGLKLYYYAMAKPVKQFDRELLGKLHQSGCRYLMWGVESGSQRVLDLMDKGTKVADIEEVLEAARETGIKNHVFIMFGFPTETREEFQATIDLLSRHKAAIAAVHRGMFQMQEGSPVFDHPEKFSIVRTWPAGQLPVGGGYEVQCTQGMSAAETRQLFQQALPFMRSFNPYSTHLGNFREHALLVYSRLNP